MKFITKKIVGVLMAFMFLLVITGQNVNATLVEVRYEIGWGDMTCNNNTINEDARFVIEFEEGDDETYYYRYRNDDEHTDDNENTRHEVNLDYNDDETEEYISDFGNLPSERLIDELHGLTKTCSGIVNMSTTANTYSEELNDCKDIQRDYKTNWDICADDKIDAEEGETSCNIDLDETEQQLDAANNQITSLKRDDNNYATCKTDLVASEKGKQNNAFLWAAIGLGVGYVLWNKKKSGGPSEQNEAGSYSDVPRNY